MTPTAAHKAPTTENGALFALLSVESIDIGGVDIDTDGEGGFIEALVIVVAVY